MNVDLSSIRNHNEHAVYDTLRKVAPRYPGLVNREDLLADVADRFSLLKACVALNRLQPRYIRHTVDLAFYQSERERSDHEKAVADAVEYAFGFVQARTAMRARS